MKGEDERGQRKRVLCLYWCVYVFVWCVCGVFVC